MDKRFENNQLIERRKIEWSKDNIKEHITNLFSKINLVDGFEVISSEWVNIVEEDDKTVKKEELKNNSFNLLKITTKKPNDKNEEYFIQVPELINDQFFLIGGYLKIPIFQIYDYPVIYRKEKLAFRNNTLTTSYNPKTQKLNLFSREVPLSLICAATFTDEDVKEIDELVKNNISEIDLSFIDEYKELRNQFSNEELVYKLGVLYTTQNTVPEQKGRSVLFSLKASYEIDYFTQPFMEMDSIIKEIVCNLLKGKRSDTDYSFKRVRFTEYILRELIRRIYTMVVNIKTKNYEKTKFQIPQTILMDVCNKSDIIQFFSPINPITEATFLLQGNLTGPGGFDKKNVPPHLRDIDESQYGKVCAAETPDRDGCGTVLNFVPTVKIDENGKFIHEEDPDVITSFATSLSPFLQNNDQIRLQMQSSQAKQAILLKDSQVPYIKSGTESCYMDKTTFLTKAKDDGVIVYKSDDLIIAIYDNGGYEIEQIGFKKLQMNTIDRVTTNLNKGDRFNKGDIITQSDFFKDGELSLGQNLLTAVMIWEGFNYEDAIVISQSVADKKFTSMHSIDLSFTIDKDQLLMTLSNDEYRPIPNVGDKLEMGEVYAKIKPMSFEEGFESINLEPIELYSPKDCTITSIEIYPNDWNKSTKEYDNFIRTYSLQQSNKFQEIKSILVEHIKEDEIERAITLNNLSRLDSETIIKSGTNKKSYTYGGQKYKGVKIKIEAVYEEQIGVGDKISNRHGNKGIISKIIPDEEMPVLPDGRKAEIVLNPLGIPSRMNVGQLYELQLNEVLYNFCKNLKERKNKRKKLNEFLNIIDKSKNQWVSKKILNDWKENKIDENSLSLIMPAFESITPEALFEAAEYTNTQLRGKVYLPTYQMYTHSEINFGYMYFLKLIHRASEKMSARSIGPYMRKTLQPSGGKARHGGHRLGEMEVWSLLAHGADDLLIDFLTAHSDSVGAKNKLLAEILQNPELVDDEKNDETPQSLKLLEVYIKSLGLNLERGEQHNE
ncbi:MAG: hypothetical protein ACOCQD_01040 [archaeon]